LLKDLLGELREHRYLLLLAIAYVVFGGLFQHALGRPWPFELTTGWFVKIWIWGSTLWLATHVLTRRLSSRARLTATQVWGAVLFGAIVVPVHITFQALKQSLAPVRGFPWDETLARLDHAVHGGPAWHWYRFLLNEPSLLKVLDMLYVSWFVCLGLVVIWLSWTHERRLRQRALLALLVLWIGAGTLGAWTLASSGPCYRTAVDADAAALVHELDASGAAVIARTNQRIVWDATETHQWLRFGGVSAMPSLHVGFAVLIAIIAWQRRRWIGAVVSVYALLVQVGSVVLAWHYGIDGYAGALCAWGAWRVAGFLQADSPAVIRPRSRTSLTASVRRGAAAGFGQPSEALVAGGLRGRRDREGDLTVWFDDPSRKRPLPE
jgi:hypothetical protein